jgi:hypothetical protein
MFDSDFDGARWGCPAGGMECRQSIPCYILEQRKSQETDGAIKSCTLAVKRKYSLHNRTSTAPVGIISLVRKQIWKGKILVAPSPREASPSLWLAGICRLL